MDKSELLEAIQDALGSNATKRTADEALQAVLSSIAKGVKKDKKVQITGFGTFEILAEKRPPLARAGVAKVRGLGRRIKSVVYPGFGKKQSHKKSQIESKTGRPTVPVDNKERPEMKAAAPNLPQFSFENPKLSKADSVHLWTLNNPSTSSAGRNAGKVGSMERAQATMKLELKMSD